MGHVSKSTTSELTIFDALSLAAEHRGKVHLLPRIPLQCPYSFKRIQFPVRLAYAMTINNKSQGQTLQKVGISLKQEVFSHGQLYTAFTRTTSGENMTLAIPDKLIILRGPDSSRMLSSGRHWRVSFVDIGT